jgi:hypothetical protein
MKPKPEFEPTIEDFGDDCLEVFDYEIYDTPEEARYNFHNEHHLCECFECEEYRKKFI